MDLFPAKRKSFYVVCAVLFIATYFLSLVYPIVYDDRLMARSSYNKIGVNYISWRAALEIAKGMYDYVGRFGHGFNHFAVHLPTIYGLVSAVALMFMYGFLPLLIIPKENRDPKFFYTSFAFMSLISIMLPWYFFSYHDFFNRNMGMYLTLNISFFPLILILLWRYVMENTSPSKKHSKILSFMTFSLGAYICFHSELLNIFFIASILGVFFLSFLKHGYFQRFFNSPRLPYVSVRERPLVAAVAGILVGSILVFTSKGFLVSSGLLKMNSLGHYRAAGFSVVFKNIILEIFPLAAILFILIGIICIILYFQNKDGKISIVEKSILLWRAIYLLSLFFGFLSIVAVTRPPYFRTIVVGAVNLPLVYLCILLFSQVRISEIGVKISIFCSALIIGYSYFVTWHNIRAMYAVEFNLRERISVARQTNEPLALPDYNVRFYHLQNVFNGMAGHYIKTSEMGHAFSGTAEEAQKQGMRVFYHIPTIKTLGKNGGGPMRWILDFYEYSGEILEPELVSILPPLEITNLPTFSEIWKERSKQF